MKVSSLVMPLGAALGLGAGCWKAEPTHCGSIYGDASCQGGFYCNWCVPVEENNGCVEELPSPECHVEGPPTDSEASTATEPTTGLTQAVTTLVDTLDGSSTLESSDGSTTGPIPCSGADDCTNPDAPFCGPGGVCVTCAGAVDPNGACGGLDPGAPLCVNGSCVQCTAGSTSVCDDLLLICDVASNACSPCAAHQECTSGACELSGGLCFPPGDVAHVDGDGGQDYLSVAAAVASVGAGEHRVIVVHEVGGAVPYLGAVLIDGAKTVALLGAPGEHPIIQGTGINPGIRISGGTELYVDGLELSNATGIGIIVDGADAWLDRSRIVGNDGGAVLAQNGANLTLRNCFVGGTVDTNVLDIRSASAEILYSTLGAGLGVTTCITCDAAANVDVRNSIVVSRSTNAEIGCDTVVATHTATETMWPGTGNLALGDMNTAWFLSFNSGDFHLGNAPFELATAAQWELGDPATDIDGDARPTTDGTSDIAGADRP